MLYILFDISGVCACMCCMFRCLFPPVTWAFNRAEHGWTSALWEFNSFHFPDCLTFSMPHISYALHLKSHMARYICTLSLVYSFSALPWALQPAPHWYSTSFSCKLGVILSKYQTTLCLILSLTLYFVLHWRVNFILLYTLSKVFDFYNLVLFCKQKKVLLFN